MSLGQKRDVRNLGKTTDTTFKWVIDINPDLEQWRALAEEYLKTIYKSRTNLINVFGKFLNNYINEEQISTIPSEFLKHDYPFKSFYAVCLRDMKPMNAKKYVNCAYDFINWILVNNFSVEDKGIVIIQPEYYNPMTLDLPEGRRKMRGQSVDISFNWVTQINPKLEQWRALAEEFTKTKVRNKSKLLHTMGKFLINYINDAKMSTIPAELLRSDYPAKSFYPCVSHIKSYDAKRTLYIVHEFIDWVLDNYFSVEDDNGDKIVPPEYRNPISIDLPEGVVLHDRPDESDKNTLPYRYIKRLRTILCPKDATHFKNWEFAKEARDNRGNGGGDWFIVDKSIINKNDPDCVWRKREATKHERLSKGFPKVIYELWSPVPAVALYTKLLLPLRTYQVRVLDSGEIDTFRYEQLERGKAGQWTLNHGSLKEGSEKYPIRHGVFRKFTDSLTKIEMTGFYINTNKTADINKDEQAKGYDIPWQYEEALFWMSKLRNWQERYNPIEKPTAWTELEFTHLRTTKDKSILKQMGSTCFLFRNANSEGDNKTKPIHESGMKSLWNKLLLELQKQCEVVEGIENKLKFIINQDTSYYPLHSLRVSLITAYALEGGVPMPILSKCIAGHSRLVMTLYYTKAGITYISEMMNIAEQKLSENEQQSFLRWLKDAELKQLEAHTVINDPAALQSVINAQQSGASFIKDDKGICPKGTSGCHSGGVLTNGDTGKITYGPVPGYPEQNCVRCRWFLTGPAFLPGLAHHFNVIGYNMGETAERLIGFERDIEDLENLQFECERSSSPFLERDKLYKLEKLHQQKVEKNDKLANDYNATLRLISRCIAIAKRTDDDELQLVAVGTMEEVEIAIKEVPSKLYQIQTVCNGATIFPETDATKAVLQRSQALDIAFELNGHSPVFFKLTPEQQLIAGNAWMQLLLKRAGSLKDAVPFVEGIRKLAEIGLESETEGFIKSITGKTLQLPSAIYPNTLKMLETLSDKEATNVC